MVTVYVAELRPLVVKWAFYEENGFENIGYFKDLLHPEMEETNDE